MTACDSVHRPEGLSLGEVNSRGAYPPGHQLLPHTLNKSGLYLLSSFLGLRAPVLRLWDLELFSSSPLTSLSHILSYLEVPRDLKGLPKNKQPHSDPKKILSSLAPLKVGMGATGTTIPTP